MSKVKPQRFTPGQEVVMARKVIRKVVDRGLSIPRYNDIVVIDKYLYYSHAFRVWIVTLVGYPKQDFGENLFDPVMPATILERELSEINEPAFA